MKLVTLTVERIPGIDEPFRVDEGAWGPGVTVVHGPNGVGKTTLCRAVRSLFWPGPEAGIFVEGRFAEGDDVWIARREGTEVSWQRNGAPAAPPPLPEERFARCFLVTLDDLYHGDRDGRWFAARVLREMAGGFDLGAVRTALFRPGERHGWNEGRKLEKARERVRRRQEEQEEVLREERQLVGMRREHERAGAAAAEREALRAAQDLSHARARLAGIQATRENLPAACARLSGDEEELRLSLWTRLQERRAKRRELDALARKERAKAAATGLGEEVSAARITEQRRRLEALRESERRLEEAEQERGAAGALLESARRRWGEDVDLDRLLAAPGADLERVEKIVRESRSLARERDELEARRESLVAFADAEGDGDELTEAVGALRAWLRAPAPLRARPSPWTWAAAGLSAVLALLAGILVHPLGFALLFWPLAWGWAAVRGRSDAGARAAQEERFARTRLAPPAAWETEAVDGRLDELERALAERRAAAQDAILRRDVEGRLARLAEREAEFAARRAESLSALGLEGWSSDLAVVDLVEALVAVRRAHDTALEAAARAEAAARKCAEGREVLAAFAVAHGEEPGEDAAAAGRVLETVEQRSRALREARAELHHLEELIRVCAAEERRTEAEHDRLFTALDLEVGDRAGLMRLLELRGEFLELEKEERAAIGVVQELESHLAAAPEIRDLDAAALERRLERAQEGAERREELAADIAGIERAVRDARRRLDLEEARAREERARTALSEEYAGALEAAAGDLLLETVEEEHVRRTRPPLLSRAAALFSAFTAGRYELDVGEFDGQSVLRATDTRRPGVGLAPDELSSGTLAQLLLAARFAFAVQTERGSSPPIFVDDALATSDPDRARAIARSLFLLARDEDRQVIVLLKDEGDLELVRSAAAGEAPAVIDLAALRGVQGAETRRERLALAAAPAVPAPDGYDGPSYAEALAVPPLDPWRPLDAAHVYHLFPDDLALVHHLVTWGIEYVGPLRAQLARGTTLSLAEEARAPLEGWLRLAGIVHEAWRTGRGIPLPPEVIRDCPAVSARFREKVEALVVELGGDAAAVVEALREKRLKGFRRTKAIEMGEWLEERGHCSPDDPLERDEAWGRLLRAHDGLEPSRRIEPEVLRRRFEYLWGGFEEAGRR